MQGHGMPCPYGRCMSIVKHCREIKYQHQPPVPLDRGNLTESCIFFSPVPQSRSAVANNRESEGSFMAFRLNSSALIMSAQIRFSHTCCRTIFCHFERSPD